MRDQWGVNFLWNYLLLHLAVRLVHIPASLLTDQLVLQRLLLALATDLSWQFLAVLGVAVLLCLLRVSSQLMRRRV